MHLPGARALVTGGAVRVGRAITLALAHAGARVIIHFNGSSDEARALAEEIAATGGEAVTLQADLSRQDEVERLAEEAERAFGGVDVLVNNASIFPAEALDEVDAALWERTMAVNLRAPFFLSQRLGRAMRTRGGGVIVNMGDLAGIQSWKGYAAHSISKAGILHLTRVAARALAPEVRVNAIAPGTVLPPADLTPDQVQALALRAPLRRNGSPDDVAQAVVYLINADFITGETILLDGGRLLA
jgi:pteridine reductase